EADRAARLGADRDLRNTESRRSDPGRASPPRVGSGRSPASEAEERIKSMSEKAGADRINRSERERRTAGGTREVERSAMPPTGTVEFPKDWAKRIASSKFRQTGPQLTEKEKKLLKALNSTLSVDFKDNKLEDVVDYLSERTGLTILLDKSALRDAKVD